MGKILKTIKFTVSMAKGALKKPPFVYIEPLQDYLSKDLTADPATMKEVAEKNNFYIGVAVQPDPNNYKFGVKEFNSVSPENGLKWNRLVKNKKGDPLDYDFSDMDAVINHAVANNSRVRGHTLIWGKFGGRNYPKPIEKIVAKALDKRQKLREIMAEHISTVVGRYKGKIAQWDVVNEPIAYAGTHLDGYFHDILGYDHIPEAFRMAHEADPNCKLMLNETIGVYAGAKAEATLKLIRRLLDDKVPLHGVGIQGHQMRKLTDLEAMRTYIQKISDMGLETEITELDIRQSYFKNLPDPAMAQAEAYSRLIKTCRSVKGFTGVTFWGVDDATTWMDHIPPYKWVKPNRPLLFDEQRKRKPAFYAVREALRN